MPETAAVATCARGASDNASVTDDATDTADATEAATEQAAAPTPTERAAVLKAELATLLTEADAAMYVFFCLPSSSNSTGCGGGLKSPTPSQDA